MSDHHNMPAPGQNYMVFRIPRRGYVVLDPSRRVVGDFGSSRGMAETRCGHLNAELARQEKRGPRPCMCCGMTFVSEGIHNRLCNRCRCRVDVLGDDHRPVISSRKA